MSVCTYVCALYLWRPLSSGPLGDTLICLESWPAGNNLCSDSWVLTPASPPLGTGPRLAWEGSGYGGGQGRASPDWAPVPAQLKAV